MKRFITFLIVVFNILSFLKAQESWIIPMDSLYYRQAEELFINQGFVPPFDERPLIADDMKENLDKLIAESENQQIISAAQELNAEIALPFPVIAPVLETGLSAQYDSEGDRRRYIDIPSFPNPVPPPANFDEYSYLLDFYPLYEANKLPSIIKAGFIAQYAGFALLFQPELRSTITQLVRDDTLTNLPSDFCYLDVLNMPQKGIISFYSNPLELRLGRDKLHIGPGNWSTFTLTKHMPYFDYIKARFFVTGFSLSLYLLNLNPVLAEDESTYLDEMYAGNIENPEPNGDKNGKPFIDRYKNMALVKAVFTPWPWLSFSITQCNLVGGRPLELADFNPLNVFHNNFDDGAYGTPISISATIIPYPGIKLYWDYYFYDLQEEEGSGNNPTAMAYQVGFTLLSEPFFKLGWGRLRLDGEFSYVDPYTYGKFYNLRKFTSRFVYVEPSVGRLWVDYPLGFYLGPDSIDINLSLAYGIVNQGEIELNWNTNAIGEVDLYGFGESNDYWQAVEQGYDGEWAPTGTPQWTHSIMLSAYWVPLTGLKLSLWYRLKYVRNRFNKDGTDDYFHYGGVAVTWKIF